MKRDFLNLVADAYFHFSQGKKSISRILLWETYLAIHTYTHAGDIPAASILEKYFPPSGTVDISLFVYKSFVVMLSTNSNWTVESAFAPEELNMSALTMQSPCVIPGRAEKTGRAEKWEKGSDKLLIASSWEKGAKHLKTSPLKANNTSSRFYASVGRAVCPTISSESMFSLATLASDEKLRTRHADESCSHSWGVFCWKYPWHTPQE